MITLTLLPMEVIVNKGDISTNMYIVQIGEAEVLTEKHSPPVAILKQGDIFGEVRDIAAKFGMMLAPKFSPLYSVIYREMLSTTR